MTLESLYSVKLTTGVSGGWSEVLIANILNDITKNVTPPLTICVSEQMVSKSGGSCPEPFDFLTDTSNAIAKVEEVAKVVLKLLGVVQDAKTLINEARSKDKDVATTIIQANKGVDTAFVQGHSYVVDSYNNINIIVVINTSINVS